MAAERGPSVPNMNYQTGAEKIAAFRREITEIRAKIRSAQADTEPQEVADYEFETADGGVRLSALFGSRDDLMVVHNMGKSCPSCTLWADGYNGVHHHLVTRAAFAVSSPDAPDEQSRFAASRGWKFPLVSHRGSSFAADMGYRSASGRWQPGISVFRRDGSRILRVSDARWSPGDDFCSLWHFFGLLPDGGAGWTPKFSYP
jgi:predicted dithiol-disulfide oxidoreductase (DUF899 family)